MNENEKNKLSLLMEHENKIHNHKLKIDEISKELEYAEPEHKKEIEEWFKEFQQLIPETIEGKAIKLCNKVLVKLGKRHIFTINKRDSFAIGSAGIGLSTRKHYWSEEVKYKYLKNYGTYDDYKRILDNYHIKIMHKIKKKGKKECVRICARFFRNSPKETPELPVIDIQYDDWKKENVLLTFNINKRWINDKQIYTAKIIRITQFKLSNGISWRMPIIKIGDETIKMSSCELSDNDIWILNEVMNHKEGKKFLKQCLNEMKKTYGKWKEELERMEQDLTPYTLLDEIL